MAFQAQVRLADLPSAGGDTGLLSFHYCQQCSEDGRMSFGRSDRENRGYAVTLFEDISAPHDGGARSAESWLPAASVSFSETREIPCIEDLWALSCTVPEDFAASATSDFDESIGPGCIHVFRSKVGGWPSWQQTPEYPECGEGRRMMFVAQLDCELGKSSAWALGGYAYLFACSSACSRREADLIIQTT
jgi:uncharacterized protein YwqG